MPEPPASAVSRLPRLSPEGVRGGRGEAEAVSTKAAAAAESPLAAVTAAATPADSAQALAAQLGIAPVDLASVQVSAELLRLVPRALAQRHELLPLAFARDAKAEAGGSDALASTGQPRADTSEKSAASEKSGARAGEPLSEAESAARAPARLFVAIADPLNTDGPDALAHWLGGGTEIVPRFVPREILLAAIERHYGRDVGGAAALLDSETPAASLPASLASHAAPEVAFSGGSGPSEASPEADGFATNESESDAPIIALVHRIIEHAVEQRASDIHLEPLARRFRVRYRIDGVLIEAEAPPKRLQAAVVSRVKLMAGISIAEKRLPQDGRIQVKLTSRSGRGPTAIDLRVSSLPTVHGESIVMRVLDPDSLRIGLGELGFMADDRTAFERLIARPDGLVLVTGPTGSGKTTTLYSCLHALNHADRKIITVEDPVEYQLSGVNQVPVRSAVGMSFAAALRAMLRQAPNIVMLGEIRDAETAHIAINASLTGHMVFSTLHTNDAPGAITRLIDIGVKPFLVATALRGVLAQRLVRRVCPACAQPHAPSAAELSALGITEAEAHSAALRRGTGCSHCHYTGYRGRIGIFELLLIDEAMQAHIHARDSAAKLRRYAQAHGLRSLREDGRRKVLAGLTTIEEVLAATLADES